MYQNPNSKENNDAWIALIRACIAYVFCMNFKLFSFGFLTLTITIAQGSSTFAMQTDSVPRFVIQSGHSALVDTIAISPDGKLIATSGADMTVKLWDIKSGLEIWNFSGHNNWVNSLAFSPDGEKLISASLDNAIFLWDIRTGQRLKSARGKSSSLAKSIAISFKPDGRILLSDCTSGNVRIWDLLSGTEFISIRGSFSNVEVVSFSHNGNLIAVADDKGTIQIFDVNSGRLNTKIPGRVRRGKSIAFSPDDLSIAFIPDDVKAVKMWNLTTERQSKIFADSNVSASSLIFSTDGSRLIAGSYDEIRIWDTDKAERVNAIKGKIGDILALAMTPNGEFLVSSGTKRTTNIWNLKDGSLIRELAGFASPLVSAATSPDGSTLFAQDTNNTVKFIDTSHAGAARKISFGDGALLRYLDFSNSLFESSKLIAISPDGRFLAVSEQDATISVVDLKEELIAKVLRAEGSLSTVAVAFNHDNSTVSVATCTKFGDKGRCEANRIDLWDVRSGVHLRSFGPIADDVQSVNASPDGTFLATSGCETPAAKLSSDCEAGVVRLWEVSSGREVGRLRGHSKSVRLAVFSGDGKVMASQSWDGTIKLWNVSSQKVISSVPDADSVATLSLSPDGKMLSASSCAARFSEGGCKEDAVRLWDVSSGLPINFNEVPAWVVRKLILLRAGSKAIAKVEIQGNRVVLRGIERSQILASIVLGNETDVIVTTPDGRFDTNKLENPQGLHWILPDAPLTPLSFEVFMRDYYEPNLLPRLLKCNEENNCDQEFKPVRNLTELNRTQPKVKISDVKPTTSADVVKVTVEAEDVVSEFQKDKQNQPLHSGVFDLRLFRDGQLVGYSTPDEKLQATFKTYKDSGEELKVWQTANKVELDKNRKTFTFDVRLPGNTDSNDFNFTAYAFNSDRVKSETASQSYTRPQNNSSTPRGNAYLITIGVNANDDRRFDLRYAANDARKLQEQLVKNLPKDRYSKIVQIPLISDYDKDGKLSENNATKAKIRAVFDKLSGKSVADDALNGVPNKDLLVKVRPEDLVLIAFSGHGYADRNGIFYLIPSDIGTNASGGLTSVLPKSISSDELSLWLRGIDAGEMMMIVDACHSAAAVQGAGFKPGPMGSRGLGQLSYDKGMRILTATQADNVALELNDLQQGLLTYSLVKNGIELGNADYQPKDTKLFSNEWLSFSVKDVPQLYEKLSKGEVPGLLIDGEKPKTVVVDLSGDQKANLNLQQPSLFDFSRKGRQFELLSLAK